jgi:solute carrier family 6 amino acid transporter-like protein 5/7/9/14
MVEVNISQSIFHKHVTLIIIGAFIIPYFCIYFLIGTPLFFLEMSLGQFTSSGSAAAFKMSRMFKGIQPTCSYLSFMIKIIVCFKGLGWATVINSFLVSIYYNVIIGWVLFYFFASFRRKLQWSDCGNWWNTERCATPGTFFHG